MVVSISSVDTLDICSAIISAVGCGGIGAIVADSRLGSSLSKITFVSFPLDLPGELLLYLSLWRVHDLFYFIVPLTVMSKSPEI